MNGEPQEQEILVGVATQLAQKSHVIPYLRQCFTCGKKWMKQYILFPWSKGIPVQKYCSSICRAKRGKGRCQEKVS